MTESCKLDVRFFEPPEDLAPCFTSFYRLEVEVPENEKVEDCLHPEWANLRFFSENPPIARMDGGEPAGAARFQATGPSSRPNHFALGTTRMWGIGLLPLGWARFVDVDASAHVNTNVDGEASPVFARFSPLCDLLCTRERGDQEQFEGLVDFFRALADPPPDAKRIQRVNEEIVDPHVIHVEQLAQRCGLSKRTLERVCSKHFGFTPRLLLRRQRVMRTIAAYMLAPQDNWSTVIDRNYHDQSHFVHEFHAFMGMSPSEYRAQPHPVLGAFVAERARAWGSPVQTLDKPN